MRKLFAGTLFGILVTGCGAEDLGNAIDIAAQRAFQEKAHQTFDTAITHVTRAEIAHLQTAMRSVPKSPAIVLSAETTEPETSEDEVEVRHREELDTGGLVTLSGMLGVTTTTGNKMIDRTVSVKIKNQFTSIRGSFALENGQLEPVAVTGEHVIRGTVNSSLPVSGFIGVKLEVSWALEGSFSLDGKLVPYSVAITHDGGYTLAYAGTLNGAEIASVIDIGKPKAPPNELAGACVDPSGRYCIEYYGYSYSPWSDATSCITGEIPAESCSKTGMVGKCTYDRGGAYEYVRYTTADKYMACSDGGGEYEQL